ncbi:3-oxosteroid 1-dehydrogenase (plasmid) [Bosea vaviloviae]|uniref:3-oxosteroid 1-dehydrogenase n=2 Tax=Bosea vaviloviae TaxID=1526658 RepID=A0A1D7UC24_9HYPH|nr:3-oxosteroid 1-dehydrogenase [Bosea vaviloviae]
MSSPSPSRADPPGVERHVCDVLVVGSGAGGMAAAVTARLAGLDVLLVEKTDRIGGTTALSGGGLWVPANPLARAAGVEDDVDDARRYVESLAGNHVDHPLLDAFLTAGPEMVSFFHANTDVRFVSATRFPDYHPGRPGAGTGRTLLTEPFDSRELGEARPMLREPLRQMTLGGMTLASGDELWHFLRASRSARSALYVARVMARHQLDRMRYGYGTRLTNGNALAARLLKTLLRLEVKIWRRAPVTELSVDGDSPEALVEHDGAQVRVEARRGIVLACGGFPHDQALQQRLFPHVRTGSEHASPAPAGNQGDGLRLGEAAGGLVRSDLAHAAAWVPVSVISERERSVFPHLVDRQKPGFIAIDRSGRRFVNEAESYHAFVPAMVAATPPGMSVLAYLVCDQRAIRKYGLGYAKPWPLPLGPHLKSGYLKRGNTPEELAAHLAVDPNVFRETIDRFNARAEVGQDPEFGRGSTAYNKFMGDPSHAPNPCLAPLRTPPYYAVCLEIGDLGTFAGLKVDAHARVLDRKGRPVGGLYAVGNDMASVLGGSYPGAGSTLGPAMVFGFLAGRHLS